MGLRDNQIMTIRYIKNTLAISVISILLLTSGCRSLQEKIDSYLCSAQNCWKFEGSVLIAYHGKIIFSKGYGMANQEISEPNTPQTKFFIGSITKQFTAAAILKLQENGLLNVNDPISKYLPDYPKPNSDIITIHHLLTHTSGIPDYTNNPEIILRRTEEINPENIMLYFKDKPLDFKPASDFKYSNSGYIVLGAIIEKVSGQSYEAYLSHKILKPIGMLNSGYARREAGLPDRADGYTVEEQGILLEALPIHFSVLHTAGALYSTVEDMLLWDQMLYTDKVLSKASIKTMLTTYKQNYGYGWVIEQRYGRKHTFHGGFLDGFNSTFNRWIDDRLCIIVFSNEDEAPVKKIARGLAAIVYNKPYIFPIIKTPVKIDKASLSEYIGVYEMNQGIYRYVALEDGNLFTNLYAQPRQLLLPQAIDIFFFAMDNTEILTFTRDNSKAIISCAFQDDLGIITASKLTDDREKSLLLKKRAIKLEPELYDLYSGIYLLESNLDMDTSGFTLVVLHENSKFYAGISNAGFMELHPSSETEFFHKTADFKIVFQKDDSNNVAGCMIVVGQEIIFGQKIK